MGQAAQDEGTDSGWRMLYRIGAVAALIAVVVLRRNFGTEMLAFGGFGLWDVPPEHPGSAAEWFALLSDNAFIGLILYDIIDAVNYVLISVMFLAVYGALRHVNRMLMAAATAFAWIGGAIHLASNKALPMLSLSKQYAAAARAAQRTSLLAAGEALLAVHDPGSAQQGTGILLSLLLITVAGLIVSAIILRSDVFSRATGFVGLIANGVLLAHFVVVWMTVEPALLAMPTALSAPFRVAWYVMIALRLLRLERSDSPQTLAKPAL